MRISFRLVKDVTAVPLHLYMRGTRFLPEWAQRAIVGAALAPARASFFLPGNPLRRRVEDLCTLAGRSDAYRVFDEMMGNVALAVRLFGRLLHAGGEGVLDHVGFDSGVSEVVTRMRREHGGAIVVVPHCTGSVLSAALVGRLLPSVVMARGSKSETRYRIMQRYLERLGPDLIEVRRTPPATVARRILDSLRQGKVVIGTTDLIRRKPDTVEARVFGELAHFPDWPARFSIRRKVPIIPAYVFSRDGRFFLTCGEPYLEGDVVAATQRWVRYFEESIRHWPADWPFVFEKRWGRLVASAASARRGSG